MQSFTDYAAAWQVLVGGEITAPADTEVVELPTTTWDRPTLACMAALANWAGHPGWQVVSDEIERFESAAVERSVMMPGAAQALERLAAGSVAVATLMGPTAARASLARHGLAVAEVFGRQDGLAPKPAPDQLLAACRALGVSPAHTLMVLPRFPKVSAP